MHKSRLLQFTRVVCVATLLIGGSALADGLSIGVKTGPMILDTPGTDDPTNGGITLGYDVFPVLDLAIEGEFTKTLDKGAANEEEVDTIGLYLAFRTPGPIYFKARAGYVSWDFSSTAGNSDDTNESYGLGIGFSLAVVQIELDYTQIEDDLAFVSLGVNF